MRLRRCSVEEAREIMALSSPGDDTKHIVASSVCWCASGLGSASVSEDNCVAGCAYLAWYGVTPAARGQGLGRRLLRAVDRWARNRGLEQVVTYTFASNDPSNRALWRAGYRPYHPAEAWAGWEGVVYWRLQVASKEVP